MIKFLSLFFVLHTSVLYSQSLSGYQTSNAHSHNDYAHADPFWGAYQQEFGSIEADVILKEGILYVAHDEKDINLNQTLDVVYLTPLKKILQKNGGKVYPNKVDGLQLLIDLKTPAEPTLKVLINELKTMEDYLHPKGNVTIVVSGNTPDPNTFILFPAFIYFDGRPEINYSKYQLTRIALISQDFKKYSRWNGEGEMLKKDHRRLEKIVKQTHLQGKKIRFWATPDNINTWKKLMMLQVDYLNTDQTTQMGDYLRNAPK